METKGGDDDRFEGSNRLGGIEWDPSLDGLKWWMGSYPHSTGDMDPDRRGRMMMVAHGVYLGVFDPHLAHHIDTSVFPFVAILEFSFIF